MLTSENIKDHLDKNPNWTPSDDAPEAEWDLFEEVYEEVFGEADALAETPWDDLEDVDADNVSVAFGKLSEEEW